MPFSDRAEAGARLEQALKERGATDAVVFGLPRGGVVVAAEVAKVLGAPLEIVIARKLGHPHNPEYAIGAVTEDGEVVMNQAEAAEIDAAWLRRAIERETREARRRREKFIGSGAPRDLAGKTAIVVDDGIATGYTAIAAARWLRRRMPQRVIVAVPVASPRTLKRLEGEADEVIALEQPDHLFAIGAYYREFAPVSDAEVVAILSGHGPAAGR